MSRKIIISSDGERIATYDDPKILQELQELSNIVAINRVEKEGNAGKVLATDITDTTNVIDATTDNGELQISTEKINQ